MEDAGERALDRRLQEALRRVATLDAEVADLRRRLGGPGARPQRGPHLVVEVAGRRLGLPLDRVQEVVRMVALAALPAAEAGRGSLVGVLDLRGEPVPVHCLRRAFGQPPLTDDVDARLVIVREAGRPCALKVDEALHLEDVPDGESVAPPEQPDAPHLAGLWKGAQLVALVDVVGLVGMLAAGSPMALPAPERGP